jgi:hypothetical protein
MCTGSLLGPVLPARTASTPAAAPVAGASMETEWGNPAAIDQLRFANPLDGFAHGEGLWSTHDGKAAGLGRTWRDHPALKGLAARSWPERRP